MEYKKDKRTKNLTLHDIHVGDWVDGSDFYLKKVSRSKMEG